MAIEITSERRQARRLPRLLTTRRDAATGTPRTEKTRNWTRRLRFIGVFALVVCAAVVGSLVYCYRGAAETIDRRLASGYLTSRAGLYAAPRVLRAGQNFSRERLVETLRRAGYVEQTASDVWSGAFRLADGGAIEISPRHTPGAESVKVAEGFTPEVVRVEFDRKGRISEITGDGVTLDAFALEPEALTNDAAMKTGTRATLAYADIPPVLTNAIRAIEDRRFFEHHGLDLTGISRALLSWTGDGARSSASAPEQQGGSTITQQLVKNTYLTPERTLRRKFNEALLAAALERRLSKEDIFALYCNEIYLGQRGAFAVRGVKQAARVYFGKELRDLSLGEAATIAGMIQSPARYAPDRHVAESRARRDAVLAAMLRDNSITADEARLASSEELSVAPVDPAARATAPYFVDHVNRAVEAQLQRAGHAGADERSLRVYTTIDLDLQQLAEQAVARQLAQLERVYKQGDARPQAALVALDPNTGHVLAMVGGKNYAASQLNRATDARRQPGSVFKPFVYAAALESGISPARLFTDAPRAFQFDRYSPAYRPANYGGGYSMRDVTMRDALTKSLNVVTVDLAMQTGLPRVAALAEMFGLPKAPAYPSLALGTAEATPLEIASAYTAFANGGARARPSSITRAVDGDGVKLFEEFLPSSAPVVQPSTAYMITDMLTNVIDEGTARAARGMLKLSAVAGKTGTSRDGWFVGYTPNLVCVVWIGFDDNRQLGLTGADSALPVWTEFVRGAIELRPELGGAAFLRPAGVMSVEIDPATGQLVSPSCPQHERIAVTPALAPTSECLLHRTLLPLLADNNDSLLLADNDARQPAPQSTGFAPDAQAHAVASSRVHASHDSDAPVVVLPAPSIQTTRIEQSRSVRPRLVNDPQVVFPHAPQR
ncbi:MAG TPA: PBP1A family penicillin-binding protein [Pyrinomonadaceae bacterium]|jgi:penicillin-binding protein 1B|nr:PBP1A family penicillin-binding protein [Pyrinomonadaceae bacterium]